MTYEPPEDPARRPPPPPYRPPQPVDSTRPRAAAPAHARKREAPPARIILLVLAALAGLCVIGAIVRLAASDSIGPAGTAGSPQQGLGEPVVEPTSSDSPPATPTQVAPTSGGPVPSGMETNRPPAAKPTPRPTKVAKPSVSQGLHPGAACSPAGAHGTTKTGKPLVCATAPTDSRLRWRPA